MVLFIVRTIGEDNKIFQWISLFDTGRLLVFTGNYTEMFDVDPKLTKILIVYIYVYICYFVIKILSHPFLYFQNLYKKYNDLINFLRMKRGKFKSFLSLSPPCIKLDPWWRYLRYNPAWWRRWSLKRNATHSYIPSAWKPYPNPNFVWIFFFILFCLSIYEF
jgi:hypothetical protein